MVRKVVIDKLDELGSLYRQIGWPRSCNTSWIDRGSLWRSSMSRMAFIDEMTGQGGFIDDMTGQGVFIDELTRQEVVIDELGLYR